MELVSGVSHPGSKSSSPTQSADSAPAITLMATWRDPESEPPRRATPGLQAQETVR